MISNIRISFQNLHPCYLCQNIAVSTIPFYALRILSDKKKIFATVSRFATNWSPKNHFIVSPRRVLVWRKQCTPGLSYHANHTMFPYMETSCHTKKNFFCSCHYFNGFIYDHCMDCLISYTCMALL